MARFNGVSAPNAKLSATAAPKGEQKTVHTCEHEAHNAPVRMRWARMLKHVFDIDTERCACGRKLRYPWFAGYLNGYNTQRPHSSLDRITPDEKYSGRPPPVAKAA